MEVSETGRPKAEQAGQGAMGSAGAGGVGDPSSAPGTEEVATPGAAGATQADEPIVLPEVIVDEPLSAEELGLKCDLLLDVYNAGYVEVQCFGWDELEALTEAATAYREMWAPSLADAAADAGRFVLPEDGGVPSVEQCPLADDVWSGTRGGEGTWTEPLCLEPASGDAAGCCYVVLRRRGV